MGSRRVNERHFRTITNDDIAEYVEEDAPPTMAQRVRAAALADKEVADNLTLLREAHSEYSANRAEPINPERLQRSAENLQEIAQSLCAEESPDSPGFFTRLLQHGGGLWSAGGELLTQLDARLRTVGDSLQISPQPLQLPCFASASASPAASLSVRRQTVTTADGVRIEFQQLPGPMGRLRLVVDASTTTPRKPFSPDVIQDRSPSYRTAFVTLEERLADSTADRHILVVSLGDQGRGFTDFHLNQMRSSPTAMPAARGACQLVGVTLSQSSDWEN